jgi:hypothetical protein
MTFSVTSAKRLCNTAPQPWQPGRLGSMYSRYEA